MIPEIFVAVSVLIFFGIALLPTIIEAFRK